MVSMSENKEFALLVGKAFLREIEASHKEAAIAFGRAFLLALGMKGPEQTQNRLYAMGRPCGEHSVLAQD
jgi:hypothetical protein